MNKIGNIAAGAAFWIASVGIALSVTAASTFVGGKAIKGLDYMVRTASADHQSARNFELRTNPYARMASPAEAACSEFNPPKYPSKNESSRDMVYYLIALGFSVPLGIKTYKSLVWG